MAAMPQISNPHLAVPAQLDQYLPVPQVFLPDFGIYEVACWLIHCLLRLFCWKNQVKIRFLIRNDFPNAQQDNLSFFPSPHIVFQK